MSTKNEMSAEPTTSSSDIDDLSSDVPDKSQNEPMFTPFKSSSGKKLHTTQRFWLLLVGLLFLSLAATVIGLSVAIYKLKHKRAAMNEWLNTRTLFPLNTIVTLQSAQNGKYLKMDPTAVSASGEDPQSDDARWVVRYPDPRQLDAVQYTGIRLENVKYKIFLREINFPKTTSPGSRTSFNTSPGTVFYAAAMDGKLQSGDTLLINAESFETNPGPATATNPFLFQVDPAGAILLLPHVPEGEEGVWRISHVTT